MNFQWYIITDHSYVGDSFVVQRLPLKYRSKHRAFIYFPQAKVVLFFKKREGNKLLKILICKRRGSLDKNALNYYMSSFKNKREREKNRRKLHSRLDVRPVLQIY